MMLYFLFIVISYLVGSIPVAVWIGKKYRGIDIREHGSQNAGATNTFRVFGQKLGWIVLTLDVTKGFFASILPLFIADNYSENQLLLFQLVTSLACIIGHVFPIFAQFRGGKGVASSLGIIIGINPVSAAISLGIFMIIFLLFKFVSLGAIVTAISYPFVSFFLVKEDTHVMIIFSILLGFLIIISHRKNIKRLINGEESRMNLSKRKS
ncbi:MAG: glycerol-3-phosphate 1-O-acyltransferase PlsY [Flavobacteriia bacterium]|nr:glycerol-3-phosphate 1-O-acyltransferase PlsY [Flavobacteriia bacterium]